MVVNQNSPIMQNMINTGQFGTQMPLQMSSYNPYAGNQYNNIIPISNVGYNEYQQLPQSSYVFAPVQQQYGYQPYNQPKYDYYNPYGNTFNNAYNNYTPYYANMNQRYYMQAEKQHQGMMKLKYSIAGACFGKSYSNEQLEAMVNPAVYVESLSQEKRELINEHRTMRYYQSLICQPPLETQAMRTARCIHDIQVNFHNEFDNHSLAEFLTNDLWKLQREFWIAENIKSKGRDLSSTYSSNDYNELLNMHRSSNPYINELLDTSRYDNNLDDLEIGLPQILDMQRRRKQLLEGKVPTYISSEETQRRRHEFTNQILNQIYNKGGTNNV